jgi:hypothetical protein
LRALKPTGSIYKVADQSGRPKWPTKVADQRGLYVAVTSSEVVSFPFDYRLNGRRETLVIGRYDPRLPACGTRDAEELTLGMSLSLAEARLGWTQRQRAPFLSI